MTIAKTTRKTTRKTTPKKSATGARTSKSTAPKAAAKSTTLTARSKTPAEPKRSTAPVAIAAAATDQTSAPVTKLQTATSTTPPVVGEWTAHDADTVVTLRKKELLERVVTASGVKKRDAKPVVEAMLKILGDALTAGEELILPPFGKAKVNRQKGLSSGEMIIVKLRRSAEQADDNTRKEPLAAVED